MATELERINAEMEILHGRRRELEDKEFAEVTLPIMCNMVGKTYKYRNSYSCPESDADYWWMYMRVAGASENGLVIITAGKDFRGRVNIQTQGSAFPILDGYIEIDVKEFDMAVTGILSEAHSMLNL